MTRNPLYASRIGIYCRISQDPNDTQLGVERQRQDCLAYCQRQGWETITEYVDNNLSGFSGKHRPAYEALCDAIKNRQVDVVVTARFDRLSRRLRATIEFCDLLLDNDVTLHDLSGEADLKTATGITMFQMAAVMAENKVRVDAENNRRMRRQLAEAGKRHKSARPYGWEDDQHHVRESEAVIVREIVQRLIDGETGTAIARRLNARHVPTVTGAEWTGVGVRKTAARASNAAIRQHHDNQYPGDWEPIISVETYRELVAVLNTPKSKYQRSAGRKWLLTGFVYCGECGAKMSAREGYSKHKAAYRCDSVKSHLDGRWGCGRVSRYTLVTEHLVKEAAIYRANSIGLLNLLNQTEDASEEVRGLIAQAEAQRRKIDRLNTEYATTELWTAAEFAKVKSQAVARIEELEASIARLTTHKRVARIDLNANLHEWFETASLADKRAFLDLLIEKIEIFSYPKRDFKMVYYKLDGMRHRFDPSKVHITWRV